MGSLDQLARQFHTLVPADNAFQRSARTLQSIWRHEQLLEAGVHNGKPLGSRLKMPAAKKGLTNFLTPEIRQVVADELSPAKRGDKVFGEPRIYDNLLSSQPMAFNLFAPLLRDKVLAARVLSELVGSPVDQVERVEFEHSPGRSDPRYTGDRSAFDVYIEFSCRVGRGFVGIEVKYHESMNEAAAKDRPEYARVADAMGCFTPEGRKLLCAKPLQQMWRDHLLVGAVKAIDQFDLGLFGFVYPSGNAVCADAVAGYRKCLCEGSSFHPWTLEHVVAAVAKHTTAPWIAQFRDRYLEFGKLDRYQH